MDLSWLSGAPGALGAVAGAIISASKANTIAKDLETAKTELRAAISKAETDVAAKLKEMAAQLATAREDLTRLDRRLDRRATQPSLPAAPSSPHFDGVELSRDFADLDRRVTAAESRLEEIVRRGDKFDAALETLARETREGVQRLALMLERVATRLEERVARRTDRGSHAP